MRDLQARDAASLPASDNQLAQSVRQKLLETDLAQVVTSSYRQLSQVLTKASAGKVGDTGRGAVLLQIESMIDIGHSSSTQLEIAEARRNVKATIDGESLLASAQQDSMNSTALLASGDHMTDFQAQEEGKMQSATVFPHRMLKLDLSDGSNHGLNRMVAIEVDRIPALDMNKTKIGAKLLIKGAPIRSGYILLSPKEVQVEGGQVHEKAVTADANLINALRAKLGKPPVAIATAPATEEAVQVGPEAVARKRVIDVDDFDDVGDDDSLFLAALDAQEETSASPFKPLFPSPPSSPARKRQLVVPQTLKEKTDNKHFANSDPISLLDSDDEELFAALDEDALANPFATSRDDPIVIESSPEP